MLTQTLITVFITDDYIVVDYLVGGKRSASMIYIPIAWWRPTYLKRRRERRSTL